MEKYLNSLKVKTGVWVISSLLAIFLFGRSFWQPQMFSWQWIVAEHHLSPWGILVICVIFLIVKRKEAFRELPRRNALINIATGLFLAIAAIFIPSSRDFFVFKLLLVSLGIFTIVFRKFIILPILLLGVYGFAIAFPLFIQNHADYWYTQTAAAPLAWIINLFDYPIHIKMQQVFFTSTTGNNIGVAISSACAGPATMAVFLALFAIMVIDKPLSNNKIAGLLLIGVVGTWLQNIVRLLMIVLAGYYWGEDALWAAHSWTIYVVFPLWYLIFVIIYFSQIKPAGLMYTSAGNV